MADSSRECNFKIEKDFGAFGDSAWQYHLTLTSWYGKEAKYDLRSWNPDMTKCGSGITLTDANLFDLMQLIEDTLDSNGGE